MEHRNWAGNVTFSTSTVARPHSVAALQQLVADSDHVRALGTAHSFNTVADTTGTQIQLGRLAGSEQIDLLPAARAVDVRAASPYGLVGSKLQPAGWALHNLGSLPHISVAGAVATATHGSGVGNGALATAVSALEFVRADGQLEVLMRGDEAFDGAVVALGALGVVTRVRLDVQPSFEVRQDVWLDLPFDADLDAVLASAYSVSLFTSWRRPEIIDQVWVKSRLDPASLSGAVPDGREWGARRAEVAMHPVPAQDTDNTTDQLGVAGPWHERLPHFKWSKVPSAGAEQQSEYLIARERLADAMDCVRAIAPTFVDHLMITEIRTIAADELWLSPFHGRDSVAVHFTWNPDVAMSAVAAVEAALAPCDPRPHWGKVFLQSPEQVAEHYPRLPDFRALIDTYDPNRKFGNAFLDSYVY